MPAAKQTISRPPQRLTSVACLRCWRARAGAVCRKCSQRPPRIRKPRPGISSRLARNKTSASTARPWPGFSSVKPKSSSSEGCIDDLNKCLDGFIVVGQALDQGGAAGGSDVEAGLDQRRGVDQQSGAGHFFKVAVLEGAEGLGDADQAGGEVGVAAGFADQDRLLAFGAREVEAHRDEALAGGGFE